MTLHYSALWGTVNQRPRDIFHASFSGDSTMMPTSSTTQNPLVDLPFNPTAAVQEKGVGKWVYFVIGGLAGVIILLSLLFLYIHVSKKR